MNSITNQKRLNIFGNIVIPKMYLGYNRKGPIYLCELEGVVYEGKKVLVEYNIGELYNIDSDINKYIPAVNSNVQDKYSWVCIDDKDSYRFYNTSRVAGKSEKPITGLSRRQMLYAIREGDPSLVSTDDYNFSLAPIRFE